MAIFGAGSNWDGDEQKDDFFARETYEIGWDYDSAKDLYDAVSLLKAGDIIYLKSNQSGSRNIRVKGIGVVVTSFYHSLLSGLQDPDVDKGEEAETIKVRMEVRWVVKDEFHIIIPASEGKLTNVRAATFYEESLPFVQQEVINKLFA